MDEYLDHFSLRRIEMNYVVLLFLVIFPVFLGLVAATLRN
jgi:hypothetical protein